MDLGSILPALITVGGSLAQSYFGAQQAKEHDQRLIDQAQQAQEFAAAEAEKARLAAKGGGGGGGAAAALQIAKMNQLAELYSNWAAITQKGGEASAQSALATGRLGTDPIIARLQALR